jgi:uncharacterized protein
MENKNIHIEVAYASVSDHRCIALTVSTDTTIAQAIEQSAIITHYPEIDLEKNKVGIFGEIKSLSAQVTDGDRVEIYRDITADPMQKRIKTVKVSRRGKTTHQWRA